MTNDQIKGDTTLGAKILIHYSIEDIARLVLENRKILIRWLHYFGTVCSILVTINNGGKPTWQHKIVKGRKHEIK